MIYLDNAATTFPKSESVYAAMNKANRELAVNTGRGDYKLAREATKLVDETKQLLLDMVHATGYSKVVLSYSITMAMNQILNGIEWKEGDNVYVTPYEHNAVARTVNNIKNKKGINIIELPLNDGLEVDVEKMKYLFSQNRPKCVCCVHVSNVTGYILPFSEIFEESKKYEAITVLDTAQSLGLVDIDLQNEKIDFLVFTGHKSLYGPVGIGGFIDSSDIMLDTYFTGGTGSDSLNLDMPKESPDRYEASSTNVVAIAGLNQALKEIDSKKIFLLEKELTEYLVSELQKIEGVQLYLPGSYPDNHIGVVSFNIEGYQADEVGTILDEDFDIAVRTGNHCAAWIHEYLNTKVTQGTVRVGIGKYNNVENIKALIDSLKDINEV